MKVMSLVFVCCILLWSHNSFAQNRAAENTTSSTMAMGFTGTVAVAGLVGGILTTKSQDKQNKDIHVFLQNHSIELQAELQMGSGEVLNDLATLMKIPKEELHHFASFIRSSKLRMVVQHASRNDKEFEYFLKLTRKEFGRA